MKYHPFVMERWQSTYEHRVRFNLSESGVHPLSVTELLSLADRPPETIDVRLGYGQSNGSDELRNLIAKLYPGATDAFGTGDHRRSGGQLHSLLGTHGAGGVGRGHASQLHAGSRATRELRSAYTPVPPSGREGLAARPEPVGKGPEGRRPLHSGHQPEQPDGCRPR